MILKAYAILDTKTGSFSVPFFMHHDALAARTVVQMVMDEHSFLSQFPADYVLYRIGSYDDTVGMLEHELPFNLGNVASLSSVANSLRRQREVDTFEDDAVAYETLKEGAN